jgi:SAM-dependent methyltransferase
VGDRHLRERTFHDRAYAAGTRDRVGKFYSVIGATLERFKRLLLSRCPPRGSALEYGCGQGGYAFFLAEHGIRVCAIDLSEEGIAQARERARAQGLDDRIDFRLMDAEQLEFDNDTFDLVCGSAILHHLELRKAFPEVARVLRPEKSAVFAEPLGHNPFINLYRRMTPHLRTEDEHPLLIGDYRLAERLFQQVHIDFFHFLTLMAVPFRASQHFPALVERLDRMDQHLFRLVPSARKLAWYSVAEFRRPIKTPSR